MNPYALRTYPSYYSMKCQGVLYSPLQHTVKLPRQLAPIHTFSWVGREASPKYLLNIMTLLSLKAEHLTSIQYTKLNPLTPMSDQDRISP